MSRLPTLLRDGLVAGVAAAGLAGSAGGLGIAIGVVAGAGLTVANLAVFDWLVSRAIRAAAEGAGSPATGLLAMKMVLALSAYGALVQVVDARGVAIGLGSALAGVCIRGLHGSGEDRPDAESSPAVSVERR